MSKRKSLYYAPCIVWLCCLLTACGGENPDDGSFNVFSPSDDITLGKSMRDEILNNPLEYEVWSRKEHAGAYALLDSVSGEILQSGKLFYRDRFPWELYIIHDDGTANAFCAPGGYIFVYTGLMKYVYNTDELAGVLAHEMAHADRRHSTDGLTRDYGISLLLRLIFGDDGSAVGELAGSLFSLNYSRSDEREADEYGVAYLCETAFVSDASKHFFERMAEENGTAYVPPFLSTHPDDGTRVRTIEARAAELQCPGRGHEKEDARLKALFLTD